MSKELLVGPVRVPGRVWIAPMTGISDLPFREIATAFGTSYVATEMVACESLVTARPEALRRAAVGDGLPLMVVQLVGAEPRAIASAARLAAEAGAQIIDLNFGCPAKTVTGVACGSALMRDMEMAERLVSAAVGASDCPVTVKMRLGWDDRSRNAAELATRLEAAGAAAFTVHARTRQQFYGGSADWSAVAAVKAAVRTPVLVNGDIVDANSAAEALRQSGADGAMIGRGALGQPWLAAEIEAQLDGRGRPSPDRVERKAIVLEHLARSTEFYGPDRGVKTFRKHLSAYIEHAPWPGSAEVRRLARARLCRIEDAGEIAPALASLWDAAPCRLAA